MKPLPFINHSSHTQRLELSHAGHSPAASARFILVSKTFSRQLRHTKFYRKQAGDMLIEALIGLVLMAIIAIGVTTITSKVVKGKREMSVQDLAVSQLQELLVKNGNGTVNLCDTTPESIVLPEETITVVATGCTPVTSTVNGVSLTDLKQPIVLSATSSKNNAVFTVGGVSTQR